jgi:hypothetical protein
MPEIAELTEQLTLKLPPEIAERFRPADRFVVWAEGEMLCLKRITRRSVTEIVEQAPEGDPMSLDEISELVHEVRQQHQSHE